VVKFFRSALLTINLIVAVPVLAEIQDFTGQAHSLGDYTGKGKWTVVMIWASDCHVCNAEAEQYIQFHEAHKNKDATVIGLSLDGQARKKDAEAFIKRHDVTFTNLIGEPEEVAGLYESLTGASWVGTPTFLVYNPEGELKAAQPGAVPTETIEEFIAQQSLVKSK